METNNINLKFINLRINPEIIKRIKNDPQLNDIQSYINNNPGIIENQVKLYQLDNNTIDFNQIDYNRIISKIRDIYNNNLLEKDKTPSTPLNDDFSSQDTGIELVKRGSKGGKTKRKKQNRKRSKFNNRPTPRHKKKTLRRKRKTIRKKN